MDKFIEWLLQSTSDGSTYLQAIILSGLVFIAVIVAIKNIKSSFKDLMGGEED